MDYIANTLGVTVTSEAWKETRNLPYYLSRSYTFRKATLDAVPCLFVKPVAELGTLDAVKKHLSKLSEACPLPMVLELDSLNARRRKSLVDSRIPFVVEGNQLYLPFMGAALQERFKVSEAPREALMPSSQLLLFHYLYQGEHELHTNGLAGLFGLSSMQITRAVRQLRSLGLVAVRKDGVQTVIAGTSGHGELFEAAKPHLLNPVQNKVYVETGDVPDGLPVAGLEALSELSMLNPPNVKVRAFYGKKAELTGTDMLIDAAAQTEIEIWRYSPTVLSQHSGIVDTLSLVASLLSDGDERTEEAVGGLLQELWGM
jgi:hypothetical protein